MNAPRCIMLGFLAAAALALLGTGCGDDDSTGSVNRPPVISSVEAVPENIEPLESSTLTCAADDPDGDVLIYEWTRSAGTLSGSGPSVTLTAPDTFATCVVTVTVSDGHGGEDTEQVTVEVPEGTLLVQTTDGLAAVGMDGAYSLYPGFRGPVEVLGTRIFAKSSLGSGSISELNNEGTVIGSVDISNLIWDYAAFAVLPDGGFAFLDYLADSIHFCDSAGNLLESIAMPNGNPKQQVADGVIAGDKLIVSENGNDQVIEVDLETYEATVFRDFSGQEPGYLSGIDYSRGWFYLCDAYDAVSMFTEEGTVTQLCQLSGVLIGITVVGDYAYVTAANADKVYKVNTNTGDSEEFLQGLNNPEDIEYVPMSMGPPIEP
jgi:hypothetical protein